MVKWWLENSTSEGDHVISARAAIRGILKYSTSAGDDMPSVHTAPYNDTNQLCIQALNGMVIYLRTQHMLLGVSIHVCWHRLPFICGSQGENTKTTQSIALAI